MARGPKYFADFSTFSLTLFDSLDILRVVLDYEDSLTGVLKGMDAMKSMAISRRMRKTSNFSKTGIFHLTID